ncbi:MAG: ribbon-helix-helix domain-containing protein [Alphaproteobacteria bacterium]
MAKSYLYNGPGHAQVTPRRHSVRIAGHRTSVSMEDAFWQELRRAASEDGLSIAQLIEAVDRARTAQASSGAKPPSLSGALRLYVLSRLQAHAAPPIS